MAENENLIRQGYLAFYEHGSNPYHPGGLKWRLWQRGWTEAAAPAPSLESLVGFEKAGQ